MSSTQRQRSPLEYRVGWISALADELAAAQLMLDETHPQLPRRQNDDNNYFLGRIAGHNIVLLCLPHKKCGKVQAAVASQQMLATFRNIEYCLMVGIGGGVPSPWDIRLGDVVVSVPTGQESGVVQYDFGKTIKDGKLHRQGSLNNPPLVLLNAVNFLIASHQKADGPRFQTYLTDVIHRADVGAFRSCLPDVSRDFLFDAAYEHPDPDRECVSCDWQNRIQREKRPRPGPKIHYCLIASGDQVMKHATTRDRLAREFQFKCFEMEAAGLMDNIPCLVIRGISDYSDSHKNNDWHRYAALVAAAYTKDLLGMTAVDSADDMVTLDPRMACGIPPLTPQALRIRELNAWIRGSEDIGIYDELSSNLQRRHGNTCGWLFSDPRFQDWSKLNSNQNVLWYNAPIASGKSVLSAVVHQHFKDQNLATAYFGYSFENRSQRKAVHGLRGLRSLAIQLVNQQSSKPPHDALTLQSKEMLDPQAQFMRDAIAGEVLSAVLEPLSMVYIIVDGLDECGNQDIAFQEFSAAICKQRCGTVKWFFTSRPEARIRRFLTKVQALELSPTPSVINSDIRTYLTAGLCELKEMQDLLGADETCDEGQVGKWVDKCDGNFLYARLMYRYWQTITRLADLALFVDTFPPNLSSYYMSTLERLCKRTERERNLARRVFMYLTYNRKSMTWKDLRNALAIDRQVKEYRSDCIPSRATVMHLCGSFLTTDKMHEAQDEDDALVRFCHKTVHDFFLLQPSKIDRQQSPDNQDEVNKLLQAFFSSAEEACIEMGLDCIWFLSSKRYSSTSTMHKILSANSKDDAFLRYASTSWFRHLMSIPPDRAPVKPVCRFLQSPNFWSCVAVQAMVSPYLFATYRTIIPERSGKKPKVVHQMVLGGSLNNVNDGFGHPLPAWLHDFDAEAKLSRAFHLFIADWHAVLTGSPNELRQCIPLHDTQSALFTNLASSKTMSTFHVAEHATEDGRVPSHVAVGTPFINKGRLHVEVLSRCENNEGLEYRRITAFLKRDVAVRSTRHISVSKDDDQDFIDFGRRSDGSLDVWRLINKPLRLERARDGLRQVFEASSLWQSFRSCCKWRIGRKCVHTTATGKIIILHLSRITNGEIHNTSKNNKGHSGVDAQQSETGSNDYSMNNESDDDDDNDDDDDVDSDIQSESSAAFSSSSSEAGADDNWQMDSASSVAADTGHDFSEGVVLLSELLAPLWIPFEKGPESRVKFKVAVHPISGVVTWSAPGKQPVFESVEFGQWAFEKFHEDEKDMDGETLFREIRFSACGQYLYCLRSSFHREEESNCKVMLHTYRRLSNSGYEDAAEPQIMSRCMPKSLAEQLTDFALVHWSPEEVILVLDSFNSRRKVIKFPLHIANKTGTEGAATQTSFVLGRPIFVPGGVNTDTKIFYQSGGRPERPHKLFLYLGRDETYATDPDRNVVDPVIIQWEIAQDNAWRPWDQAIDGRLEGWDQEYYILSKLGGMYIDEGKKVPSTHQDRVGLD